MGPGGGGRDREMGGVNGVMGTGVLRQSLCALPIPSPCLEASGFASTAEAGACKVAQPASGRLRPTFTRIKGKDEWMNDWTSYQLCHC